MTSQERRTTQLPFHDRREAGNQLANSLVDLAQRPDLMALGLPRGGVPVAWEVAHSLGAPLDACIVRKLGVPGQKELAMGAIGVGSVEIFNEDIIRELRIPSEAIDTVVARERQELDRRETRYRANRPPLNLRDRTVILVDDGLATGATMLAAITIVRQQLPKEIIVAVPVAAAPVVEALRPFADRIACLATPADFVAIGAWYEDFRPTSDDEVVTLLNTRTNRIDPGHPNAQTDVR